jgi:hypothetical protein
MRADVGTIDDSARTVDLTFATGDSVLGYDWASGKRTARSCRWNQGTSGSSA